MEICCLSRSGDSVSSALCCRSVFKRGASVGLGLDSVIDWDKSVSLYTHDTMAIHWQLCSPTGNPTTDSYHRFLLPQSD
eukprot:jgi/Chrzof1/5990/UNPLg00837.t1